MCCILYSVLPCVLCILVFHGCYTFGHLPPYVVLFVGFLHVFASSHDAVFSPYSNETEFPTVCVTICLTLSMLIFTYSLPLQSLKNKCARNQGDESHDERVWDGATSGSDTGG